MHLLIPVDHCQKLPDDRILFKIGLRPAADAPNIHSGIMCICPGPKLMVAVGRIGDFAFERTMGIDQLLGECHVFFRIDGFIFQKNMVFFNSSA